MKTIEEINQHNVKKILSEKKIGIDIETKIQEVTEENVMPATEDMPAEAAKEEVKEVSTKVESQPAQENVQVKEEQKQEQPKEKIEQKK